MKKTLNNVRKYLENPKIRSIIFWSVLILIATALFFCFIYSDILITVKHSLNLLQTTYDGHPMDFFAVNYGLVIDNLLPVATRVCYEIPIFIIFAIWNIPVWIAQGVFHISITESLLCLIWLKSMLVFFLALSVVVIRKICLEVKIDKKYTSWVAFAFISSPLLLVSLFIMSQYDIIAIFFMLLGILAYIKGNSKWFIIWFSIAIVLKLFALFVFVPLILLKNKKVIKSAALIITGTAPLILIKLFSSHMPMYEESMSGFSDEMLSKLFAQGINVNFGVASLFCIALVAISIFCYLKNIKDKEELNKFSIYIPLLVFSCFFIFVDFHPYWIILITPFFAITLFQNIKKFKINILLDIISSISIIIATMFTYYWCYGPLLIERMVLPRIFGSTYGTDLKYPFTSDLLSTIEVQKYLPFFLAVYATCTIAMLIVNFPRTTKKERSSKDKIEWGLLLFRLLIIIPVPILMIFCYFCIK